MSDEDDHQNEDTVPDKDDAGMLKRFDAAEKAGAIDGRKWRSMWIEDHATEQKDVLRATRIAPPEIHRRHAEWKGRSKRRPS